MTSDQTIYELLEVIRFVKDTMTDSDAKDSILSNLLRLCLDAVGNKAVKDWLEQHKDDDIIPKPK